MGKTLVIGSAIIDICMKIGQFPSPGQDIVASEEIYNAGGGAMNVGFVLQAYDVPFALFAPVGTGRYGQMAREALVREGFEIVLEVDDGDNGHCFGLLDESGERTYITLPGVECSFRRAWFDRIDSRDYTRVYVGGYAMEGESGQAILSWLEEHPELELWFAPGPRITVIGPENMERMWKLHPILHLNDVEACAYTGAATPREAARALHGLTGERVFVTRGEHGCFCCDGEELTEVPAQQTEVVNTSGAGDAHIAGLITAFAQGMTVREAMCFANRIAASVVGRMETKYRKESDGSCQEISEDGEQSV